MITRVTSPGIDLTVSLKAGRSFAGGVRRGPVNTRRLGYCVGSNGCRSRIWNCTRWMWMGCASPVVLMMRQISTEPARGVSVTGSAHGALISAMIGFSNGGSESSSLSTRSRVRTDVRGSISGTGASVRGTEPSSRPLRRLVTLNSITLVGMMSSPSGNGAFASLLSTNDFPLGAAEVDDHVEALGDADREIGQPDGRRQESPVGADLDERGPRAPVRRPVGVRLVEREVVEARVRRVQDAEAILPRLDLEERPHPAVDQHRVAEELRDPHGRHARIRIAAVVLGRVPEGAVGVEEPILDGQRDLERPVGKIEAALDAVAKQVDPLEPGVVVEARRPERVVVVPELRGRLIVRIVIGPLLEERPGLREAVREPRLGIAVALREHLVPVQMDDGPHRRLSVDAVQCLVDREHVATRQFVYPAHGDGLAAPRLERGADAALGRILDAVG